MFNDTPNNGAIDGFPVEIYINDEFLGIYTWNIPKDAWMFNMDEDNENHIVFSGEGWTDANKFEEVATYDDWAIEVGRGNQADLDKLNRLINFIDNSSNKEFQEKFDKYLNFDATINYMIIAEYALLDDNLAKNMLLVTYDGKIWYPSLYDLDTSWGTDYDGLKLRDYENTSNIALNKLFARMLELYPNEIAERYYELKDFYLNKEHILELFNDFNKLIPEKSFEKENERWHNIPGYNYSQIEDFLDVRIPIIENLMKERKSS